MSSEKYYESQETILNRMLSKVDNLSTIEGSTTYLQQSPVAIEMENIKMKQDEIIDRNNIISAYENGYDDDVVKYAAEDGVDRKTDNEATGIETFYGTEGTKIEAGFKFSNKAAGLVYETVLDGVIDSTGSVDILSVAVEKGAKYNAEAETLNYILVKQAGVTGCTNKAKFTKGRDIESIDDLFYRHQLKVRKNPNGGNKAQYEQWCLEVEGVGSAKIYSLTDENMEHKRGHVCCVITNSEKRVADEELCNKVKNYIDPGDGDGSGVAPCNSIVHVISATEKTLDIKFKLTYSDRELSDIKTDIENIFTDYLKDVTFNTSVISITKIGSLIYKVDGVTEYDELTINDLSTNIPIGDNEIPVLGSVTINE